MTLETTHQRLAILGFTQNTARAIPALTEITTIYDHNQLVFHSEYNYAIFFGDVPRLIQYVVILMTITNDQRMTTVTSSR